MGDIRFTDEVLARITALEAKLVSEVTPQHLADLETKLNAAIATVETKVNGVVAAINPAPAAPATPAS